MNFRFCGATVCLLMAILTPVTANADHKMPRNLSANGPWRPAQWVTGKASRGFKSTTASSLAVDQAGVPALIEVEEELRAYFSGRQPMKAPFVSSTTSATATSLMAVGQRRRS